MANTLHIREQSSQYFSYLTLFFSFLHVAHGIEPGPQQKHAIRQFICQERLFKSATLNIV